MFIIIIYIFTFLDEYDIIIAIDVTQLNQNFICILDLISRRGDNSIWRLANFMTIAIDNKVFTDKKQALCELAFCHFPVSVIIDGNALIFEEFSVLENYILTH